MVYVIGAATAVAPTATNATPSSAGLRWPVLDMEFLDERIACLLINGLALAGGPVPRISPDCSSRSTCQ
jgi:hypothetical protein